MELVVRLPIVVMMVMTMSMVAVAVAVVVVSVVVSVVAVMTVMMMMMMSVPMFFVVLLVRNYSNALPNHHRGWSRLFEYYHWLGSQLADDHGDWRGFVSSRFFTPALNGVVAMRDCFDNSYFAFNTLDTARSDLVTVYGRCPKTVAGAG